jgi:YndJ-like protein
MNYGLLSGASVWLASVWLLKLPLEASILLFAPLVLLPPAIQLIEPTTTRPNVRRVLRLASWMQLPAATLLAVSFAFPQGLLAAGLALPWLVVTLILALAGALLLWQTSWRPGGELAIAAAMLFVAVGGAWAVVSRAGMQPQDFSPAIVLLTGVHFHFAGFVLPLLAGLTTNLLNAGRLPSSVDRSMLLLIVAGVPLVGVGISLSPLLEVVAALLLVVGCCLLAVRQVQAAMQTQHSTVLALLAISSLALLSAMIPAAIYAYAEFTNVSWLDIPTMIRTHGACNAFGFAACGVLGHSIARGNSSARCA